MKQVLVNVMGNARSAQDDATESIQVQVSGDKDHLRISVRDFGEGLPEGQEDRLFEPFFTTRTKGTGLGLSIAQRIVELHGGTIRARNHQERGAVISIDLPSSC